MASMVTPDHAILVGGPRGVTLLGKALDPALADGSHGSGVVAGRFRVTSALTGAFVGSFEASRSASNTWTATADLSTGSYSIQFVADDLARNSGYSPTITVFVLRLIRLAGILRALI